MAAASSSSSSPPYDVFPSFSGEDVRRTFLSHVLSFFKRKTIKTFEDVKIQKGETVGPELIQAIRASKISMVVLSKKYASSSWCLNELLEIMNCKEAAKQKVITIFYGVDPSDVRKQTGDFGKAFENTCVGKTEEKKQSWSKALTDAANIAGYHSHNWPNEVHMMKEIATDILNKLNCLTIPKDFDDLVGMEDHLTKIESLLCPKSDEVRMIGILGPRGIGKTTIARALYHHLSRDFELSCFVENIRGRFSRTHHDAYSYKLHLQQEFLSLILDDETLRLNHSRLIEERLSNHRVLVVLDDVDGIEQLQALADKTHWFGAKSRIVVITENKHLLIRHGINYIYEVNPPSRDEALQIFCQYAFRQNSPPDGFYELAKKVVELASVLPLGLSVLGSSLYGRSEDEWRKSLPRLQGRLDGKIERELRVGYDCLDEKDQAIFRHIACMFSDETIDYVKLMLDDSDLDIELGLESLDRNSLIQISSGGIIEMHDLLQQMGREIVREQNTNEPGKREFLVEFNDIKDVLTNDTGNEVVLGISLDLDDGDYELSISGRAFDRMTNLQFLRFRGGNADQNIKLHLPGGLNYLPSKLRLLHWNQFPMKSLPIGFCPQHLVEFVMRFSKLVTVWEGSKRLERLKRMDLSWSKDLKEIPDLSEAKTLETLNLCHCDSLVTLPSSIGRLIKLKFMDMNCCKKLEVLPINIALESLSRLNLNGCSRLKSFPEISQNIGNLSLCGTAIEEVPTSIMFWSRLASLEMSDCKNLKAFPRVPDSIEVLDLSRTGIDEVPVWIGDLSRLRMLDVSNCENLNIIASSISKLEHLETVEFSGCRSVASFPEELFQSFSHTLNLSKIHANSLPVVPPEMASTFLVSLDLSNNDFENIPDGFKFLSQLHYLNLNCCTKLVSLPELPRSLLELWAEGCELLQRISCSFENPKTELRFTNCLKLNQEAQELIQQSVCRFACLPGRELPAYITLRASGSSLTIDMGKRPISGFWDLKACVVLAMGLASGDSEKQDVQIYCSLGKSNGSKDLYVSPAISISPILTDHLFVFDSYLCEDQDSYSEAGLTHNKMLLEFNCSDSDIYKIKECGVQLLEVCPSLDNWLHHPGELVYITEEETSTDTDGGYDTV